MLQERGPVFANRTVRGILIPATRDLLLNGFSHLLVDDHREIYLVYACRKSVRMSRLNRTRVEIRGVVVRERDTQPRIVVNSYCCADSFIFQDAGV